MTLAIPDPMCELFSSPTEACYILLNKFVDWRPVLDVKFYYFPVHCSTSLEIREGKFALWGCHGLSNLDFYVSIHQHTKVTSQCEDNLKISSADIFPHTIRAYVLFSLQRRPLQIWEVQEATL